MHNKKSSRFELLFALGLILAAAALAYLPMAGQLGYYHDDWHTIASLESGTSLIKMFSIDRPGLGLVYTVSHALVGDRPLGWQLYSFLIRAAGAFGLLWLFRQIWPARRLETALVALLFIVYPGFLQEPSANTFSNHFLGFSAAIFSLAFTIQAVRAKNPAWMAACILLAVLSELFYLFIYEYMVGLEAVRLLLLSYVLFQAQERSARQKWTALLARWLPYLAAALIFLVWRVLIFKSARSATNIGSLVQLARSQPLDVIARLVIETAKDWVTSVFVAWGLPLYTTTETAAYRDLALSLVLAAAAVGLAVLYVRWLERNQPDLPEAGAPIERPWAKDAVWLGAAITVLAILPVITSLRDVEFRNGFDRYTLQATFGVCLLVVGFIFYALREGLRVPAVLVLLAVSVVTQINNTTYYRDFWSVQRQLWWQTTWRAPALKTGTVLMPLLPAGMRLGEDFEAWAPANRIYHPGAGSLDFVSEVLNTDTAGQVIRGEVGARSFRRIDFQRDFKQALIASMPTANSCVHFIDGSQPEYSASEDPLLTTVGAYSRIDQIIPTGTAPVPDSIVFGAEPAHGWCYYYQKASLARQQQDWAEVVRLGDEASSAGLSPQDAVEWMPFLEGYAALGRTADAARVAAALKSSPFLLYQACQLFTRKIQPGPGLPEAVLSSLASADCQ